MREVKTIFGNIVSLFSQRFLVIVLAIATFFSLLLVLPQYMIDIYFIGDLRAANLSAIGSIECIFSFLFVFGLAYHVCSWIRDAIQGRWEENRRRRDTKKFFDNLSGTEISYLQRFIENRIYFR